MKRFLLRYLFILFSISYSQIIIAQTTWEGDESSDWNTSGNWTAGVPDAADAVTINTTNLGNWPTLPSGTTDIGSITLNGTINTNASSGTLRLNTNQGINTFGDASVLGTNGQPGTITTLSSITVTWTTTNPGGSKVNMAVSAFRLGGESRWRAVTFNNSVTVVDYAGYGSFSGLRAHSCIFNSELNYTAAIIVALANTNTVFSGNTFNANATFNQANDIASIYIASTANWLDGGLPTIKKETFNGDLTLNINNTTGATNKWIIVEGNASNISTVTGTLTMNTNSTLSNLSVRFLNVTGNTIINSIGSSCNLATSVGDTVIFNGAVTVNGSGSGTVLFDRVRINNNLTSTSTASSQLQIRRAVITGNASFTTNNLTGGSGIQVAHDNAAYQTTIDGDLQITNSGSTVNDIFRTANTGRLFVNGDIKIQSTGGASGNRNIRIGDNTANAGTVTLAAGKAITTSGTFDVGTLYLYKITQTSGISTHSHNLVLGSTATLDVRNSTLHGNFSGTSGTSTFRGNTICTNSSNTFSATLIGTGATNCGGNTINGGATINHSGNAPWYWGHSDGGTDWFKHDVTVNKSSSATFRFGANTTGNIVDGLFTINNSGTGTANIGLDGSITFNSDVVVNNSVVATVNFAAGNTGIVRFNGNVDLNQTAAGNIHIGDHPSETLTGTLSIADNKVFDASGITSGVLWMYYVTQLANTNTHNLTLPATSQVRIERTTLRGNINLTGNDIRIRNDTLGSDASTTVSINLTGTTAAPCGLNIFDGVANITNSNTSNWSWGHSDVGPDVFNRAFTGTNSSSGSLRMANNTMGTIFNGNATFNNTGTGYIYITQEAVAPYTTSVTNSVTFNGDVFINNSSNGGNISGRPSAIGIARNGASQVVFNGDVTLTNSASAATPDEGSISFGQGHVYFGGDITVQRNGTSSAFGGNHYSQTDGRITFNGSATQNITSNQPIETQYVIVDKSGGYLNLVNNSLTIRTTTNTPIINPVLNLISGNIRLNGNDLILNHNATYPTTLTGGSSSSYIQTNGTGILRRQVTAGSPTLFPVGSTSQYLPLTLTYTGASDLTNVRVTASGETSQFLDQKWEVTHQTPAANPSVVADFTWNAANHTAGFDPADCGVLYNNGVTWVNLSAGQTATGSDPYSLTSPSFTKFASGNIGTFTIGSVVSANAGSDITVSNCGFATMAASPSSIVVAGYPVWRYAGGTPTNATPVYQDSTSETTIVSNLVVGVHKFRWFISSTQYDSMLVTVNTQSPASDVAQTWNGQVNDDWFNCANWTGSAGNPGVPTSATNVTIPAGLTSYPTLVADAVCNNFTLALGATIDLQSNQLTIGGAATIGDNTTAGTTITSDNGIMAFNGSIARLRQVVFTGDITLNTNTTGTSDNTGGLTFNNRLTVNCLGGTQSFGRYADDNYNGAVYINTSGTGSFELCRNFGATFADSLIGKAVGTSFINISALNADARTVIFNGVVDLTNQAIGTTGNAPIRVCRAGSCTFNNKVYLRQQPGGATNTEAGILFGANRDYINSTVVNDELIIENTRPTMTNDAYIEIGGYKATTFTFANNGKLVVGPAGLTEGDLRLRNLSFSNSENFNLTTTGNTELYVDSSYFPNNVTVTGPDLNFNNNLFGDASTDTVRITSNATSNLGDNSGNNFVASAIINMIGTGVWDWGVAVPDTFESYAYFGCNDGVTLPAPQSVSATTNFTTNYTAYPTNYSPAGDLASEYIKGNLRVNWESGTSTVASSVTNIETARSNSNIVLSAVACAIDTARLTDSLNSIMALDVFADAQFVISQAIESNPNALNSEVNASYTQLNYVYDRVELLNVYLNNYNTTLNTCLNSVRTPRLGTGTLQVAHSSANNVFGGRTIFETQARGRLRVMPSSTSSAKFNGDSLIIVNKGAGGTDGAFRMATTNALTSVLTVNSVVRITNITDSAEGRYNDPKMTFGGNSITALNNDVIVESYGNQAGHIYIGAADASAGDQTFAAGKKITIGSNGFKESSNLYLYNIVQSDATPISLTLDETSTLSIDYSHFLGTLNLSAGWLPTQRTRYMGNVTLNSVGATEASSTTSSGGNRYSGNLTINVNRNINRNYSWQMGTTRPDTTDVGTVFTVNHNAIGVMGIANDSEGNLFNGKLRVNTVGKSRFTVSSYAVDTVIRTIATFNDTVRINNTGRGMGTGSGDWLKGSFIVGIFQSGTIAESNTTIFNKPLFLTNTNNSDSADFDIGFRGAIRLNDSVIINNNIASGGTNFHLAFAGDNWSGACQCSNVQLADGYKIKVHRFKGGQLTLRRFKQLGSTEQTINIGNENNRLTIHQSEFNGGVYLRGKGMELLSNTFYDTAQIVTLDVGYNSGGNTFKKKATFEYIGSSGQSWNLGTTVGGDLFEDRIYFKSSGTGNSTFGIAYNRFNTVFEKPVSFVNSNSAGMSIASTDGTNPLRYNVLFKDTVSIVNSSSNVFSIGSGGRMLSDAPILVSQNGAGNINFGSGSDNTDPDTLLANGSVSIISYTALGRVQFYTLKQTGTNLNSLINLGSVGEIFFEDTCVFNGEVVTQAPSMGLRSCWFNGKSRFTKSGNTTTNCWGGSYFGDSAFFRNISDGDWTIAYYGPNTYYGTVILDQDEPSTGTITLARTGLTSVRGNVVVQSNKGADINLTTLTTSGNGIVFEGNSDQTLVNQITSGTNIITANIVSVNKSFAKNKIMFDKNFKINNTLSFTKGTIDLGTQNLIIASAANNITGGNDSAYILATNTGVLNFEAVTNSNAVAPLGNSKYYLPVVLQHSSGTAAIKIRSLETINSSYNGSYVPTGTNYTGYFVDGGWIVEQAASNLILRTGWGSSAPLAGFDNTKTALLHYNNSNSRFECISGNVSTNILTGTTRIMPSLIEATGRLGVFANATFAADAGNDIASCLVSSATVSGVALPTGMSSVWSTFAKPVAANPNIVSPNDASTLIDDLTINGLYTFRITNNGFSGCPAASDDVNVIIAGSGGTGVAGKWTGLASNNWNACANWENGTVPDELVDVDMTGTFTNNAEIIDANAYCRNLSLGTGKQLLIRHRELEIHGNLANSGTITQEGAGWLGFFGNTNTTISGEASILVNMVKIEKDFADKSISISSDLTIDSTLQLQKGLIVTGANKVVLPSTATATFTNDSSFVSGRVAKTTNSTASFTFPIGKDSVARPITIEPTTADPSTFEAEYYSSQPYHYKTVDVTQGMENLNHASDIEYWDLDRTSGSANAFLTLTTRTGSIVSSNPSDWDDLRIAHWNGAAWENVSTSGATFVGNFDSGTLRGNSPITSFSPFTIGSLIPNNPLPNYLLYVSAQNLAKAHHQLVWQVANAEQVKGYIIQASDDGQYTWKNIGYVKGDRANNRYKFDDYNLHNSEIVYYRLKIELEDHYEYSDIVFAKNQNSDLFVVHPNPAKNQITVETKDAHQISIINSIGETIITRMIIDNQSKINVNLENIPSGVYFVRILNKFGNAKIIKLVKN